MGNAETSNPFGRENCQNGTELNFKPRRSPKMGARGAGRTQEAGCGSHEGRAAPATCGACSPDPRPHRTAPLRPRPLRGPSPPKRAAPPSHILTPASPSPFPAICCAFCCNYSKPPVSRWRSEACGRTRRGEVVTEWWWWWWCGIKCVCVAAMGRAPCCEKDSVKRGPWTPEEDAKLLACIAQHGTGSWRTLPKKAGMARCGFSKIYNTACQGG